jgi:hypothetical protein
MARRSGRECVAGKWPATNSNILSIYGKQQYDLSASVRCCLETNRSWSPQSSQGIIVILIFSLNGTIDLEDSSSLLTENHEWYRHQALPEADRSPLRASLAQDAFVHPDHPLHKEGVEGAELFLGN